MIEVAILDGDCLCSLLQSYIFSHFLQNPAEVPILMGIGHVENSCNEGKRTTVPYLYKNTYMDETICALLAKLH